jgi:hypothetical protein
MLPAATIDIKILAPVRGEILQMCQSAFAAPEYPQLEAPETRI